jgi:hypothetical protein
VAGVDRAQPRQPVWANQRSTFLWPEQERYKLVLGRLRSSFNPSLQPMRAHSNELRNALRHTVNLAILS